MTAVTDPADFNWPDGDHAGCRVMSLTPGGPWECVGMHCAYCGKPCGAQGHMKCFEENRHEAGSAAE
ncbi:hypothetical protein AVU99_gp085 [Mycobacterium phage Lolly9]|uniref:Uncharacterized protein n=1 Tax=Mycobacterium phage Lolly9 TaxID=1698711 RepID=A0A0K2FMS3_9CAUD|nr:hypothetical protein AVU99_gp085 [Mycobacterium phage Lolly9]ALA48512.1 hypothetical protein LOLLY9_95 [Mycobacterium phage Lolly9]QOP65823.1 hypothetical protein PBI_MINILON_100 [Mycobacterium phage MiniLon]QOP66592.1 hypothetical protein PBI_MINIMAC_100 [Mycobacterium phage MiniMac]